MADTITIVFAAPDEGGAAEIFSLLTLDPEFEVFGWGISPDGLSVISHHVPVTKKGAVLDTLRSADHEGDIDTDYTMEVRHG